MEDLPNMHLRFFDRYEIHIQAFVHFIIGKLIIVHSSSPQNYFEIYNHFHKKKNNKSTQHRNTRKAKSKSWYLGHTCSRCFHF